MDAKRPPQDATSASPWCTRAVWRLFGQAGRMEEAGTTVYRSGVDGLRQFVSDLIDIEAVGYTGSGAAYLLQALLRDINWESLASAVASRYNPEAEYPVLHLRHGTVAGAEPVVLSTTIFPSKDAAVAAARAATRQQHSPGALAGAGPYMVEVRRQPRYPQPSEVLLTIPVAIPSARTDQRAG